MNIHATDVRKTYGDVTALDGLSVSIPDGSTFGIIGTNGAGKSTLFKLLIGHDRPDGGIVTVGGMDVTTAGRRIREHVGYLPERIGFPGALTGREVLGIHTTARGLANDGRIDRSLDRVGLSTTDADRPVSGYSNGMQRRLGLATALVSDPSVLVLDEPTAGLDPRGVEDFHRIIERINADTDATIVLCSHVLSEVERLCDRVAVLHDGRVRASGPVETVAGTGADVTLEPVATVDPILDAIATLDDIAVEVVSGSNGASPDTGSDGASPDTGSNGASPDTGSRGETAVSGPAVAVHCDPDAIVSLLASLEDVALADVRVDRPGLTAAFHDVVTDSTGSPNDGGGSDEATTVEAER